MSNHNLFSPLSDYDLSVNQGAFPSDWHCLVRRFRFLFYAILLLCFMLLMLCRFSFPVNAAELRDDLGATDAMEISENTSEVSAEPGADESPDLSVSSGDVVLPGGFQTVVASDGTVYYASSIGEVSDASEEQMFPLYDSYEQFMESPLYVTRYENEVLKKLEYCQYAFAIEIALLFLLIFKKK